MWQNYDKAAYTAHQQQQEADRRRQEEQQRQRYQDEQRRMMEQQRQQQENMRRQTEAMRNQATYSSPVSSTSAGYTPKYLPTHDSRGFAGSQDFQPGTLVYMVMFGYSVFAGVLCYREFRHIPWLALVCPTVLFPLGVWLISWLPRWFTLPVAFLSTTIPVLIIAERMRIEALPALGIALASGVCNAVSANNLKKAEGK